MSKTKKGEDKRPETKEPVRSEESSETSSESTGESSETSSESTEDQSDSESDQETEIETREENDPPFRSELSVESDSPVPRRGVPPWARNPEAQGPDPLISRSYHVKEGGNVFFHGKLHKPGEVLQLTDEQAKDLGANVELGNGFKPGKGIILRAGRYVVTEFGSICRGGKFFSNGMEIDLDAGEAKQFADRIRPV